MSIEKARKYVQLAMLIQEPSHGVSLLAKTLFELIEVLEDMSAKMDKLTETQARRG
jgi:hypothetical protein